MKIFKSIGVSVALIVFGLLFILSASSVSAQSTGTILGVVKDSSGGAVPGAKVTVTNTDTTESRTTTTGEDGAYRIPALQPGHYTVRVEKEGFKTGNETGLNLEVAQDLVVNPGLEVGSATQEVTVTGEAPIINTTNSSLGGLVNDQQIVDLPLNGRNFIDLALLQPGVANTTNNGPGLNATWFSSNGAPIRSNNVTLDGAPLMSVKGTTASAVGTTLGVDGIQEYRVLTSSFAAEYGISVGSQIVIVSKGGTNQFHGDVFDYLRNDAMDASGYFAKTRPKLIRNNFGGSFGGPIIKGKTFFYAVYEGLRQRAATTSTINTLPANCHVASANPCATASGGVVNGTILPFLQFYPIPNVGTNQFTYNPVTPQQVDYGQIRLDHTFSEKDSLFARLTTDESNMAATTSYAGTPYQGVGTGTTGQDIYSTLSETHIFSPNVLNTLRFSYSRTIQNTTALIPDILSQPNFVQVTGQVMGGLAISSGELAGIGPPGNVPQKFDQNLYTLSDDVFYTKGKHAFKFGMMLNRIEYYTNNTLNLRGATTFSNRASFLAGTFSTATFLNPGSDTEREPRFYTYGFYAQDDWRVSSRLTLNLGLRYEPDSVPWDRHGANWAFRNVTDPVPTQGPVFRNASFKNLGPRVGFAWDVRGNGKTSLRAAFGEYYDVNAAGFSYYTTGQGTPPLSSVVTLPSTTLPQSGGFPLLNGPQNVSTGLFQFGSALHATNYGISQPHLLQWNLSVAQQLTSTMALSVSYVGTRGIHLWDNEEGNSCLPKSVTADGIPNWGTDIATSPVMLNGKLTSVSHICNSFTGSTPTIATYPGSSVQYVVPTRLNPLWGDWVLLTTGADSFYHGLQAAFTKRVSRGLQAQIAYTFSRSTDDAQGLFNTTECSGSGGDPIQALQPERRNFDRGPSCFDIHHNMQISFLYHLPTMKGSSFLKREVLSGWWIGNKSTWQTGYPFTPVVSNWRSLDQNITSNNNGAGSTDYVSYGTATVLPGGTAPDGTTNTTNVTFIPYNRSTAILGNASHWFNPLMFTMNPIGQLGTATKNNALRGPHFAVIDLSLNKDTAVPFLGEKGLLEFRVEAFNIFNNTNWALPQGHTFAGTLSPVPDVGITTEAPSATAGQITAIVGTPRQLQLSLKLMF